ncbi:bifunctional D-glycero-beta-D-manno-heptose-7-phosphate kinase/D-glycero-beta-D-manno-heptose 1-phosphate adenylyltransferase HldE [Litorivicinus sp.]|nr:bifunctional D-glycero-beta-D-manno-heptose-7-phosphate kinase/D-glycero-beta-D-manno-heptose 1-phosphate adenylyltransferase HldE [Litorivicinus sp.]
MPQLFGSSRILVAGDVMVDRYWHGSASRISPEAPVPVVQVTHDEVRPGGAANVALNLSVLGVQVLCAGLVGCDEEAGLLEQALKNHDVDTALLPVANRTVTKLRVVSQSQQMIRLDFETPFSKSDAISLADTTDLSGIDILVLSDYAKGTLAPSRWIARARLAGIPVVVDPKGANFEKYRGATLITPNRVELEAIIGPWAHDQELVDKVGSLIRTYDFEALLVTRSEEGMTLITKSGEAHHFAATAREVADVTGAGDTVIATVAAGLGAGLTMVASVELANRAAGIAVSKLGTVTVSKRELERSLQNERFIFNELEDLVSWVKECHVAGEKVVMTNGCFDILHAGHVAYLKEAALLGNRLVVAVNSDASVTRLKGLNRPVNAVERRLQVLAGLSSVDAVIAFEDDTPEVLIDVLRPDILVKGGDYKSIEDVVGFEKVQAYGGEVRVLAEVVNLSTSHLIEKIRQSDSSSTN